MLQSPFCHGFYVDYDHLVTGETTAVRENGATSGIGVLATFGYDDLGQRTSLTRGNGTSTSYAYDPVSRLSSLAQDLGGTGADLTLGFGYTPASQIAGVTRSNDAYAWGAAVPRNDASTANGLNQVTNVGAGSLAYDARGNLTSAGSTSYAYSAENVLQSVSGGTTLYYDAFRRLIEYDTNVSTRFVYDGAAMTAEIDGASGQTTRRYVHGPGIDEPLVEYDAAGNRTWLHADERGSIVARSDASGAKEKINSYDAYGVPATGNVGRFGYTGQAWLPHPSAGSGQAGLWYYKARMYAPTLGRFLQTDPIGYADGMNLYNYVGGDPVNFTDPSGLNCADDRKVAEARGDVFVCGGSLGGAGGGSGNSGSGSQQNIPNDAPPTEGQPQVGDDVTVTAKRICGFLCRVGRFLGIGRGSSSQNTYCSLVPRHNGVTMASVSGSITIPFFPKSVSLSVGTGIAIDPAGNLAIPAFGFLGRGVGASESLTANYTTSDAKNFGDFNGGFGEVGGMAGLGLGGGVAKFVGPGNVSGTTYSAGEVVGDSAAAGGSYTDVGPSVNLGSLGGGGVDETSEPSREKNQICDCHADQYHSCVVLDEMGYVLDICLAQLPWARTTFEVEILEFLCKCRGKILVESIGRFYIIFSNSACDRYYIWIYSPL